MAVFRWLLPSMLLRFSFLSPTKRVVVVSSILFTATGWSLLNDDDGGFWWVGLLVIRVVFSLFYITTSTGVFPSQRLSLVLRLASLTTSNKIYDSRFTMILLVHIFEKMILHPSGIRFGGRLTCPFPGT